MMRFVLFIIVLAQFLCTSLWFAGNAVMDGLVLDFGLSANDLGHIISAVQFGFIIGTLVYAIGMIADRYSPSKVFFISALLGAICNISIIWNGHVFSSILLVRFLTGFFLAGIYPVGMKIAADYYDKGLGKSLGYLVGALVLGTALPHLLQAFSVDLSWRFVFITTSILSALGGLLIYICIPDGPYRKPGTGVQIQKLFSAFKDRSFRSAAFGYFGHMWELYAFWTFVPVILLNCFPNTSSSNIAIYSFIIIAAGSAVCVLGGYYALRRGSRRTALIALSASGLCCLVSPLILSITSPAIILAFLIIWGMMVIADSPQFSTLVAQSAPAEIKGTALTIVNCIGFAITIISIQLLNIFYTEHNNLNVLLILAIGPILGLYALKKLIH